MTNIWKSLRKGTGIKVEIPGDVDELGKQKIRPGIVIKKYPSHIKIQLLSTQSNQKDDYYQITINNKIGYIRPIYHITIPPIYFKSLWFERGKKIMIEENSVFFRKIIEMEYKEIFDKTLDLSFQQKLEKHNNDLIEWNRVLQEENEKLKFQLKNQDKELWKEKVNITNKKKHEHER